MKYAINTLPYSNVSLNDSRLFIKVGGWAPISDSEAESDYVVEALRNGWISLSDTKPSTDPSPDLPPLEVVNPSGSVEAIAPETGDIKPVPPEKPAEDTPKTTKKAAAKAE